MWAAGVGDDHLATAALLRGCARRRTSRPAGTPVLPALDFRHVTVVNSTALRIALRQVAFYQIDEPETITARIPASALASDLLVVASPQIVIRATPGSVVCGAASPRRPPKPPSPCGGQPGHPAPHAAARQLESLHRDCRAPCRRQRLWLPPAERATLHALVEARLRAERARGWAAVMVPRCSPRRPTSRSRTTTPRCSSTCPPPPSTPILAPETIFVRIPPVAVASAATLLASPPLVVHATPGEGTFGGTLAASPRMETLQAASGGTLLIELSGDTWAPRWASPTSTPRPAGWGASCWPACLRAVGAGRLERRGTAAPRPRASRSSTRARCRSSCRSSRATPSASPRPSPSPRPAPPCARACPSS